MFRLQLLTLLMLFAAPLVAQEPSSRTITTAVGTVRIETLATGLEHPWGLVFLPDGSMLVSEEDLGHLRRISPSGAVSAPITGLPSVASKGHGGLFGLALDPRFEQNKRIYFAFAEPGPNATAGLAVARAVLGDKAVTDVQVLFRQEPKTTINLGNFGGRVFFAPDGLLLISVGDRFQHELIQDLRNTHGTLVRITPDGKSAPGNPFIRQEAADPRIWSFGHRNIEGGAIHPETGEIWVHEFGPRGGDELNIALAGKNYGWPLVSWGRNYSGEDIPDPPSRPDLEQSIFHWFPVISPSGMLFYNGSSIPQWNGNVLIGGLSSTNLMRLTLRGDRVISDERIDIGARVRDVAQGPDGAVYLITDQPKGDVLRLTLESAFAAPVDPSTPE